MHIGGTNSVLGYAIFCGIKLAGYMAAFRVIDSIYEAKPRRFLLAGVSRTLLGMGTGALLYLFMQESPVHPWLMLLPVRLAEWWLMIWVFYARKETKRNAWLLVFLATIWSYMLDIPAALGFFMEGGFGIC